MASNSYKTISIKGTPLRMEGVAGGTITPGHLVKKASDGTVVVHDTAAGTAAKLFAYENDIMGDGISVNYSTTNKRTQLILCHSGCVVNALVAASASAIVIGDALESAGDGTLRLHTPPANLEVDPPAYDSIIGYAEEAVDNSAGSAVARIAVAIA